MEIAVAMIRRIDGVVAVVDRLTRRLAEARLHPDEQALHGMADDWLRKLRGPAQGRPTVEVLLARSVASGSSYHAVVVGRAPYAGRRHKDTRRSVRRHRRALAERPLWLFSSGSLDRASERDMKARRKPWSG